MDRKILTINISEQSVTILNHYLPKGVSQVQRAIGLLNSPKLQIGKRGQEERFNVILKLYFDKETLI
jgi:hypothetical protein